MNCPSVERFLFCNRTTLLGGLFIGQAWRRYSVGYKRLPIESDCGCLSRESNRLSAPVVCDRTRCASTFSAESIQKIDTG